MLRHFGKIVWNDGSNKENPLGKYEFSKHSQNGEDGIINWIFKQAGVTNKQLIEIGFSEQSNARALLESGWKGLLIDASPVSIVHGRRIYYLMGNVRVEQQIITTENANTFLLSKAFSNKPDLLSIDIDGNDYHIWKALTTIDPRIVVVEYNASFGPELSLTIPYTPYFDRMRIHPIYHGASLTALTKLGVSKGYGLIGVNSEGHNAFYAKKCLPFNFKTAKEAFINHSERRSWQFEFRALFDLPLLEV